MQQKVAPPLSLKVDSNNLNGHNRIIKVTITNTSMEVADLARCRLVAAEELNKSVNIHYKNIAGSVVQMDWKKEMPYLQVDRYRGVKSTRSKPNMYHLIRA